MHCVLPTSAITALLVLSGLLVSTAEARGGRRGGKGKGKSNLQFAQVAEFSLVHTQLADNNVSIRCYASFILKNK